MLSSSLRKNVQKLWDAFWAGGIANPLTAIEQITYLIYLKQIEDLGRYPAFFEGKDGDSYRWSVIRHMPNEQALVHLKNKVFERLRGLGHGGRMSGAELLINSPNLLGTTIQIIDDIFITSRNQDTLGDIYEELLREIAVAGKNGQFRTPRHIIRLMCDLVDPKFGERICDPAAGTGGFLVNAYQHILKRQQARDNIDFEANGTPIKLLEEDPEQAERLQRGDMFVGYDFDQTMVRLGWMNMTLHGIKNPHLNYGDTLNRSFDAVLNDPNFQPFDVIFANPPFTGSINRNDIAESLSRELTTDKTELLFVERIYQMLAEEGRAAIILPEGVLFGSTNAHKALREKLLERTRIKAVISLPGGVFQPYTGVKTSILIFQKGGSTDKAWFYELTHDGQTLDAKRNERPEYNDAWDLTVRYANRYHVEPPAFVHPQRAQEWEQWRAMDDETRRQSYVLPLFVHSDRFHIEYETSVYPTTMEQAYERYYDQQRAETKIAEVVQEQLRAAQRGAQLKALITLQTRGRGDRQKAALEAGQKYLRDAVRTIRSTFEQAAEGVLLTTEDERHGYDELIAAVERGLGDTKAWTELAMADIADALANTLFQIPDAKTALAAVEQMEPTDLAPLIEPFKLLDGINIKTFGRLRLIKPELREQIIAHGEPSSKPFVPMLPKEWEVAVEDIKGNDINLSAGRYKPFTLATVKHDKPQDIIRDLRKGEIKIQRGLRMLQRMIEGRE